MDAVLYALRGSSNIGVEAHVHDEWTVSCDYAALEKATVAQAQEVARMMPPKPFSVDYTVPDWCKPKEEKPKLSHYPDAKIDDTREVDGVTWRVVKVEDDTTVWWGKGAYAKMEVCCPPLPPRDESYGRKSKVKDLGTGQPVLWRDSPTGRVNKFLMEADPQYIKKLKEFVGRSNDAARPAVPLYGFYSPSAAAEGRRTVWYRKPDGSKVECTTVHSTESPETGWKDLEPRGPVTTYEGTARTGKFDGMMDYYGFTSYSKRVWFNTPYKPISPMPRKT